MGLLQRCEEVFGTADLYQVLGVRREASAGEVRRGYHKVSLQVHPDRVAEGAKEDATRRFQVGPARPPGGRWWGPSGCGLTRAGPLSLSLSPPSSQILGQVYAVLSDQEKRAVYDELGAVSDDSDAFAQDHDWRTYWRLLFKKVV